MKLNLKILFFGFSSLLLSGLHAQVANLYAEPNEVIEMETSTNNHKVIGSTNDLFFIYLEDHHKAVSNDRVIAYSKSTLKQVWIYEIHEKSGVKHQLLDGPYVALVKEGILVITFSPYVKEGGLSMITRLINPVTGVAKNIDTDFYIKSKSDKLLETPTVKLRLFSQDSSKMYVFTADNVYGQIGALTVTCVQMKSLKAIWSKPMELGGMMSNMKFDNEDNLFCLAAEENEKRFDTYLCKYNFTVGKADVMLIKPDGNRKVNPDLYGVNKRLSASAVSTTSAFNALKMELTDKGEVLVAGFFEEESGKPGYLFQFYNKTLKKQSEKADYLPKNVDEHLSKREYSKTDFYTQEIVKIGNVFYIIGEQYSCGAAKIRLYDYVIVSLDEAMKTSTSLLPQQDEESYTPSDKYPLNCFKHSGKLWVSYIKKRKDIKDFEGKEIMDKFKTTITSTDGKKSKNLFVKIDTKGIEAVTVLGIALNDGKEASFEDRLGNSKIYNYELPLAIVPDGNKAIVCFTNIIWPNGRPTKYCFGKLELK